MRYFNSDYRSNRWLSSVFTVMATAVVLTFCLHLTWAGETDDKSDPPVVAKCKADLAKRLKLQVKDIKVIEARAVTWSDSALGMPEEGKMYLQALTPGHRVILQARGHQYLYTTGGKSFKYGGPVYTWACSMLYLMPIENEPNLNSDLYQCSLRGTNARLLVSRVEDYYPQANGVVLATRRTSRSSHELLYVNANESQNTRTLHAAFDFGEAALNDAGDRWAAFVRRSVGGEWTIVVSPVDQGDARVLPLPRGTKPGSIAWSDERLLVLVKRGERSVCLETSPGAENPEWKESPAYTFPETSYMLNKSESLEISQGTADGKPCVEVALVWFTGDRKLAARISDLTLEGHDFLYGRYAFIWGKRGSETTIYTVDIWRNEILPGYHGDGRNVKPFLHPPHNSPIAQQHILG